MKKKQPKQVNCGFDKWTMGFDKDGNVFVSFNRWPIDGTITLFDTSIEDLENLGEMFLSEAKKCREFINKLDLKNKKNKLKGSK